MIRILVADDHEVVRVGLKNVLEFQSGWTVVGEAENGEQAVSLALELQPGIVLMDCLMPRMNGIDATRQIRVRCPCTEVLMFSMYNNEHIIRESLLAGARGYLLKMDAKRKLVEAVETVAKGQAYFSPSISDLLLQNFKRTKGNNSCALSGRERQVVQLIAEGYTNKCLAIHLGISLKTVETHRAAIMAKLKLGSAAELVRYAVRNCIVEP